MPPITYIKYREIENGEIEAGESSVNICRYVFGIPLGYSISLPLPTLRAGMAGYAFFASPALRQPGVLLQQAAPSRWWIVNAHTGILVLYAPCSVFPFAENVNWGETTLPSTGKSRSERAEMKSSISSLMDTIAPVFFAGDTIGASSRKALLDALITYLPEPLLPQYRALAPDFFSWLQV